MVSTIIWGLIIIAALICATWIAVVLIAGKMFFKVSKKIDEDFERDRKKMREDFEKRKQEMKQHHEETMKKFSPRK